MLKPAGFLGSGLFCSPIVKYPSRNLQLFYVTSLSDVTHKKYFRRA